MLHHLRMRSRVICRCQRSVHSEAIAEKATEVWLFDLLAFEAIEAQQEVSQTVYAKPTLNSLWPNGSPHTFVFHP